MNKQYFFLSGVPRSGSTVLSTLLSQNPKIYCTPTSPLLDITFEGVKMWDSLSYNILNKHPEQRLNVIRSIFHSVYKHVDRPIILDKHRSWPRCVNDIKGILEVEPKIIVTTRDVPEILASFISILQKNGRSYVDDELRKANKVVNNSTRCRHLWENYVSVPWKSLKYGYENHRSNLHFVDYEDIVNNPKKALEGIYNFLEIEPFNHTFNSLVNLQPENDEAYGVKNLHHVRPVLKRVSPPAEQIIGEDLVKYYRNLRLEFWKR